MQLRMHLMCVAGDHEIPHTCKFEFTKMYVLFVRLKMLVRGTAVRRHDRRIGWPLTTVWYERFAWQRSYVDVIQTSDYNLTEIHVYIIIYLYTWKLVR